MSTKEKENTLNRIKQFFRSKPSGRERVDFTFSADMERDLRPETPVSQRCKALKELGDSMYTNRWEDASLKKLWDLTKDLIVPNKPTEQRHTALNFYKKLIQGQYEGLSMMRAHYFKVIQNHDVAEDIFQRLDMLKSLTDTGKDITYFEEGIGKFLLDWVPEIVEANLTEPYLEILVNIVKYNAAYLDKEIVVGIVHHACIMSCTVEETSTVLQWLSVLDNVICYAIFPNDILTLCIVALCRTVNREAYCQTTWKIMKNLLGTNLGHACLLTMCNILNDRHSFDEAVLRGAVFHINMGIWGSSGSVVPMLKCSPSTVLLSFLHVLDSKHIIVTYEVVLSIQRLIQKNGKELPEHSWDVICNILSAIHDNINVYEKSGLSKDHAVQKHFHETLDMIESMMQNDEIAAEPDTIYNLIEKVAEGRPQTSVLKLIEYRATRISATRYQWLQCLNQFMIRFFRMSNTQIRIKSVHALMQIMKVNRAAYEEEILERIVMPNFSTIAQDPDIIVRSSVAQLLVEFTLHCDTKRCMELLDIIEKLLNRPYELNATDGIIFRTETDVQDLLTVVEGLIQIFLVKLYRLPSCHATRVFQLLVGHLEQHYQKTKVIEASTTIKYKIFSWMLQARANATFHVGYPEPDTNKIRFSHYFGVEGPYQQQHAATQQLQLSQQQSQQQQTSQQQSSNQQSDTTTTIPLMSFTTISIRRGCKTIVKSLEIEKDWQIIQLILKELPNIMQNKALIQGNDVDSLARTLYKMYFDESIPETYFSTNGSKPSLSDYRALVLPAIASLAIYHQYIDPTTQKGIVEALKKGLFSRIPRSCVQALTVMILEMPETLVRLLPEVLLEMSKMSNTMTVAIPVLEFLSTLSRLPNHRFANFVTLQYMYVFAISLPYTNPDRYDHYTVSLAHHVIAGWFLKCRLPLRRNLVNYIIAGLESNVHMPFQEIRSKAPVNEDSSNRKRSSSLTEQGSRRRERPSLPPQRPKSDLYAFHMELAETCIDFMARHTFSPCSALPKRLPTADFLLAGGQSLTWLVGHNLITITTSGCTASPLRNGLCDRCSSLCKSNSSQMITKVESTSSIGPMSPESSSSSKTTTTESELQNKRYTKASLQHSNANQTDSTDLTSSMSSMTSQQQLQQQQQQPQLSTTSRFMRQSSTDGRYSSSSGSLEALSRRGSNPDTPDHNLSSTDRNDSPTKNLSSTIGNTLLLPQMPTLSTPQPTGDRLRQLCACSCTGWAEICIRRPTGSMSWVMRIQNQISYDSFTNEFPLHDLTSLFMPSLGSQTVSSTNISNVEPTNIQSDIFNSKNLQQQQNVETKNVESKSVSISERFTENKYEDYDVKDIVEAMKVNFVQQQTEIIPGSSSGPIDIPGQNQKRKDSGGSYTDENDDDENNHNVAFEDSDGRSRNPVRRVNSSPEMSSNWRNPFLNSKSNVNQGNLNNSQAIVVQAGTSNIVDFTKDDINSPDIECQQKKKNFAKDMRVSCEAIPEEIAGSTPPSLTGSVTKDSDTIPSKQVNICDQLISKQDSFIVANPSTGLTATTTPTGLISSVSLPEPDSAENQVIPRKQLSADDAKTVTDHPQIQPTGMNLKIPIDMPKVTAKPPQSPAPLSPRLLARNAANKIANNSQSQFVLGPNNGTSDNNNDFPRGRSKTISTVRDYGRDNLKWNLRGNSNTNRLRDQPVPSSSSRSGISPSFVFLQLYHTGQLNVTERPIRLDAANTKAVALLDLIPPFETHKIGVLYVGPGQCNETEILKNRFGSLRYAEFLRNLGTLVAIKDAKEHNLFINMESNGRDGNFTYIWQDDIVQVTFHVATLMPNKESDPNCNEKKLHIGNDFVTIVYNESGEEYNLNTIKGQFTYACVIVQPMELNSNRVFVRAKDEISEYITHSEPKIISDNSAPLLARQLALHANLASLVSQSLNTKNQSPYASNWLERLRKIKHMRTKLIDDIQSAGGNTDQNTSNSSTGGAASSSSSSSNTTGGGGGSSNDLTSPRRSYMNDFTEYTQ